MIVNRAAINAVFTNLRTIFNKAFAETTSTWQKIAMRVPSNTKTEDYAWLSKFPKMKKWIGDKAVKALAAFKYTITNDDFEATVGVDRNDIDDDTIGIYAPQAQGAGESAKEFPDDLVYEAVNGSFANKCYDGQYYCDTDHPVGPEGKEVSVSNKGTAPLSNLTLALANASFGAARVAMRKFKDDEGRSLNVKPNVLLVPPGLEVMANMLMTNEKLADDTPNPFKGMAEVVCDNRLESDTAWFLLDTTRAVKPFIFQERKAPKFVQQVDPESDDVFNRRILKFGCEARGASGYGFWQLCYGSTGQG
ncbi:MAG: Mu-like prophage major head subunit gpT family protein [Desulfobacterium sp.]|nr:Mu-like prophage major head subunit gpT family protein [Desulfobacterium sp.]